MVLELIFTDDIGVVEGAVYPSCKLAYHVYQSSLDHSTHESVEAISNKLLHSLLYGRRQCSATEVSKCLLNVLTVCNLSSTMASRTKDAQHQSRKRRLSETVSFLVAELCNSMDSLPTSSKFSSIFHSGHCEAFLLMGCCVVLFVTSNCCGGELGLPAYSHLLCLPCAL